MKILALRLANLASLPGPLELDFTRGPLAESSLFAITGPTGAGKSTLLDALCLALYGNTPRLRQAPQRDSQVTDTAGVALTTADPRTLLRRGTAAGHAEVDFVGRDGRRYRARWAVRRAREKISGKLQAVEQSLRDLDDDRLLTAQKREFDRLLPERLGLTFEQFTRAVLLAQSEFAAFLKADDNARSDLLERLTGTREYSAISMAAYRRASEARKAVEKIETRLADDLPADAEARAELEQRTEAAQRELDTCQNEAARLESREQWHTADARLREACAEGRRHQEDAETRWQALASARDDQAWRRVILPQRHRLTRQAELPGEIQALETTHAETLTARDRARAAEHDTRRTLEQARQVMEATDTTRRQAEPRLRETRELAQRLATQEQQLAELERTHEERRRRAASLAEQQRQADDAHARRREQRHRWHAALQRLIGDHEGLDTARQAAQRAHEAAAQRQLALSELHGRWQEACRADQAHQTLKTRLADNEQRLTALLARGQAARQRLDDAERHLTSIQAFVERSRAVRSESVIRLREALADGEPCPVCGGLEHPWRHRPPASPEAAQLAAQQSEEDRQLADARTARDTAQRQRDELQGEYRALKASVTQQREDLGNIDRQRAEAHRTLEAHPLQPELAAIAVEEREGWLNHQQQTSEARRSEHRRVLDELARAEAELAPLNQALHQDEIELARLGSQQAELEQELAGLAERLPSLRQARDALATDLRTRLGEHASPDAWQQHLDARQESARQARDAAQARHYQAQHEHQRLAQQADHEAGRLEALRGERDTLAHQLADWRAAHPDLTDDRLARLLAQTDADAEQQARRVAEAETARQQAATRLAERRRALLDHRRGQGLGEDEESRGEETADILLGDAVEADIERRRRSLAEERDALLPRLEAAQQTRDAAVHALRDDDRKRARQQAGRAELETARAEYRRWGGISELIGSADGKAFRRIAQAYNLEQLLEHANAHLGGLTRRYRLLRGGSELGLLVADHDMADERRSVHSLSGGETFLVSLALALGLASMASGELVIESLFIDEGFGSLDPQSLALAMEALDGLQAQGRRVGVISHVQEMHERIPVQIRVEPEGNGTSRARLVSG
ncbi:AAA family ATPase [Modicisalibacter tunisiensis]|uniref:AAA family ATPase n=1 Tax=Modicisalibacter tunisiensis TaxID=390637 RepID=UPI001CCE9550|nr:AAA family ATPase [Modicisalibacter tunisiensis]MBZ9537621.1 AAA family ATPase [Modicisalibacter tunisiensis]